MIDIITVSTHDAKKLAADLVRLLEAEEHSVRMLVGRQSQASIEDAKTSRDAVLIIWSEDAPSQTYMLEWLRQSDATRLVEIATAPGWPERKDRKAPVIDFSSWRGERGGRAWNALSERLKAVSRVVEPPKPPARHAAIALGIVSIAAVGVAMGVRANQGLIAPSTNAKSETQVAQLEAPTDSVGGALYAMEPASVDDLRALPPVRTINMQPMHLASLDFNELSLDPIPEVREPTFIERLQDFVISEDERNQR
ncbi:hypothetical protein [Candidatus Viadribacter manganicus]|uniref:TIR domain-containing protein n=1 Tax=Candidatus Viadribacter manganicus TaxID=1759059 RepID=A0A1B1AL92_9PROT|nr:hypothetical protein [Candidatus Viadribacter manganicus]ANP47323.1 hypothetical protein ATE48_16070 [Candidatus Viadribacter manganicus]